MQSNAKDRDHVLCPFFSGLFLVLEMQEAVSEWLSLKRQWQQTGVITIRALAQCGDKEQVSREVAL